MVAQGGGIGRALTGWIRSAGKSSVREIANLSHFRDLVRRFQGGNSPSLRVEPRRISCLPRRQLRGPSEEVMRATDYAGVLQTPALAVHVSASGRCWSKSGLQTAIQASGRYIPAGGVSHWKANTRLLEPRGRHIANCDSGQRPIHPCRWRKPPESKHKISQARRATHRRTAPTCVALRAFSIVRPVSGG